MTSSRGWRASALLLAISVAFLVAVPSLASGATTVRTFTASEYRAIRPTPSAAPPVATGGHLLRHFGVAPGFAAAGTQGTSPGLEGTTVTLTSCAAACTDDYRPASSVAIPAGSWVERQTFTVTQPRHAGTAVGFDLEVAVHLTTGWVVGTGYLSTGVATGAGTSTVTLQFFVNLGATAPTVTAVLVTVNSCTATTGCP